MTAHAPEPPWPPALAREWIADHAGALPDEASLIRGLGQVLLVAGAPVNRLRILAPARDPRLAIRGVGWSAEDDLVVRIEGTHESVRGDAYAGSPAMVTRESGLARRWRLTPPDADAPPLVHELARQGLTDYVALPLLFGGGETGVMTVATRRADGFGDDDLAGFEAVARALAPLAEARALRRDGLSLLETYVGPRSAAKVWQGQVRRGDVETIDGALWLSDLRGFTELCERLNPTEVIPLLNRMFEAVAAPVAARGGEVMKLIGDAMLALFPVAPGGDPGAACAAAYDAALDADAAMAVERARLRRAGLPELAVGIGLDLGAVAWGNVGALGRLDFTVIGPAVNRAARLEALTRQADCAILMSDAFAAAAGRPAMQIGSFALKGFAGSHRVWAPATAWPGDAAAGAGAAQAIARRDEPRSDHGQ